MEEETRSLRGLRTIYTEEQRQWFKDHCAKFSIAQWCVIMNTDKTIKEISDSLSFPNPSAFGTFFKKQVGMSPVNYRVEKREK